MFGYSWINNRIVMRVLDLFSGIGGFSLGLERAGFKTVAFCEIEPYCQKVLKKHWPDVPIYDDVREVNEERLRSDGITDIGVITGGFPCQDISVAGKQKGIEGERSGLWSELHRIIDDVQPQYAILENVAALISGDRGRWFGRVLGDLAEIGYDAEWHCIPASAVGAPHQRDRVWIISYPNSDRESISAFNAKTSELQSSVSNTMCKRGRQKQECKQECKDSSEFRNDGKKKYVADTNKSNGRQRSDRQPKEQQSCCIRENVSNSDLNRLQGSSDFKSSPGKSKTIITRSQIARAYSENGGDRGWWATESDICRVANGVSRRVDRIKGLGNAVVPQIPEIIGRAILND
jgi:DNA (cytosine-5)-methyltransferase 1